MSYVSVGGVQYRQMKSFGLLCMCALQAMNRRSLKKRDALAFLVSKTDQLLRHLGFVYVVLCVPSYMWRRLPVDNTWHLLEQRFLDVTQSLVDRWMGHTQNHCFSAEGCGPRGFTSNYGLFSSLFIWRLKCSLGAPFSTLVWLKRLSERHSFQHGLAVTHAQTYTLLCKCTKHTCKHTRHSCCIIFFMSTQCALGSACSFPKFKHPIVDILGWSQTDSLLCLSLSNAHTRTHTPHAHTARTQPCQMFHCNGELTAAISHVRSLFLSPLLHFSALTLPLLHAINTHKVKPNN